LACYRRLKHEAYQEKQRKERKVKGEVMKPAEVRKLLAKNRRLLRYWEKCLRESQKYHNNAIKQLRTREKQIIAKCDHKFSKTKFYCVGCQKHGSELAGVTI
jgi:hypothetical protein